MCGSVCVRCRKTRPQQGFVICHMESMSSSSQGYDEYATQKKHICFARCMHEITVFWCFGLAGKQTRFSHRKMLVEPTITDATHGGHLPRPDPERSPRPRQQPRSVGPWPRTPPTLPCPEYILVRSCENLELGMRMSGQTLIVMNSPVTNIVGKRCAVAMIRFRAHKPVSNTKMLSAT